MKVPNIFLFLIYLSYIQIILSNNLITIPFRKEVPNLSGATPSEIFQKIKDNIVLAEFNLGSPSQKLGIQLLLAEYGFYIGGHASHCAQKFEEKSSNTYKKLAESKIFRISTLNEGVYSSDFFYFNNNFDDKKELNFLLGINTDKNKGAGIFGLNFQDSDTKMYADYNFINILKKNNIITEYYFSIEYKDNNSGNLIIGDMVHLHDDEYNKKYYKEMYITEFTGVLTWNVNMDSIYTAPKDNLEKKTIVGEKIYAYFKIEYGMVLGTDRYKQYLLSDFLSEKIDKKLCFEERSLFYISYYCKEEVDLTQFKSLFFYIEELDYTFELDYKDLFYKNDDGNNYFLVYFNTNSEREDYFEFFWTFGEPFFKKYNIIFNQDAKRFGFYTAINDEINEEKTFWQKNKWYIILIIILVLVFSGLGIMIFLYLKVLPKRKIKANELDDGFEYTSDDNKLIN